MRVNPWPDAATACVTQWTAIASAVELLPDEAFGRPTALPGWRVAELVAHLAMCASSPARWLSDPAPSKAETDAANYVLCLGEAAGDVDLRTRERAGTKPPGVLRAEVRLAVDELAAVVAVTDAGRVIPTRLAPMRFDEFLISRTVEGVVHGLDLDPVVDPDRSRCASLPKCCSRPSSRKRPGTLSRCGCRRSPPCSASKVLATPGGRRPMWSKPTRSRGCGWPPAG